MKKRTFLTTIKPATILKTAALVSLLPLCAFAKEEKVETEDETFFTGSSLNGGLYLFGRNRDRLDATGSDSVWNDNLDHISTMVQLGLKSRDYGGVFGYEFGGFAVWDMYNGAPSWNNQENEFSFAAQQWGGNYEEYFEDPDSYVKDPRNGVSLYRAMAHVKLPFGLTLSGGLGQIGVEGVIGNNWSYFPGAYTGGQAEWAIGDKVTLKYAIVNEYKAPWFIETQNFSTQQAWGDNDWSDDDVKIDYLQGASIKFVANENMNFTASYGRSEGFMQSWFGKIATSWDVADGLTANYLVYLSDTDDKWDEANYDGLAHYHVLMTGLSASAWNFKLEATHTEAPGAAGNYLPRMTKGYANSQGGFQVWWDMRSDWQENGETAIYANVSRKLDFLGVDGWTLGAGAAYGFGCEYEPSGLKDGKESAWKVDLSYTTDLGRFKGATFAMHYMQFTNHQSELGDWAFPNMFSSEKDFMVKAILPFGMNL